MTQWKWYRWNSRQTANTSQRHSKNRQRMAHKLRTNWHYNLVACEFSEKPSASDDRQIEFDPEAIRGGDQIFQESEISPEAA